MLVSFKFGLGSNLKELILSTVACKSCSWSGDSLPLVGLCGVFDGVIGTTLSVLPSIGLRGLSS